MSASCILPPIYPYDSHGRVLTTTDAEGRALTHGHDALDRPTSITYPDGSTETFAYSQDGQAILSPTEIKQLLRPPLGLDR